jgi:hypothetical protein
MVNVQDMTREEYASARVYNLKITCGKCSFEFPGAILFSPRKSSLFVCPRCLIVLELPPSTSFTDLFREILGLTIKKTGRPYNDLRGDS